MGRIMKKYLSKTFNLAIVITLICLLTSPINVSADDFKNSSIREEKISQLYELRSKAELEKDDEMIEQVDNELINLGVGFLTWDQLIEEVPAVQTSLTNTPYSPAGIY